MKKKYMIIFASIVFISILLLLLLMPKKEKNIVSKNDDILYSINFKDVILRIKRYDHALGQNQIIGVEKSIDGGNTFSKITEETVTISMEPKFIFFHESFGFVISKENLTKHNNYMGFKVTTDGGKTFKNATINYENPKIDILTIEDVPYYENGLLKLHCSIYQMNEDKTGYEDVDIIFVSNDNGLTWNEEKNIIKAYLEVGISKDKIKEVEEKIKTIDGIDKYIFKDRMTIMNEMMESSDTLKEIMKDWTEETTPIQDVFEIYVSNKNDVSKIKEIIKNFNHVSNIINN